MKKIVIIEDDRGLSEILQKKLTEEKFEVFRAGDGAKGLEIIKGSRPDIALLDIMLPGGMNGFDVLEELRRDKKYAQLPVIILTNLGTEEKTARLIGASDYIVKANISLDELIAKVRKYLN